MDGDAAIDIVFLSLFWHKPADETTEHPLKNLCRDLIFCATRVRQGIDLEVERFKRKVDEDKKKDVMGQSAWPGQQKAHALGYQQNVGKRLES